METSEGLKWLGWNVGAILDEKGSVASVVASGRDITDKKVSAREVKESRRMLQSVMDHLPGMVYLARNDKEWSPEFVSYGSINVTGYTPDTFINKEVVYSDIILPQDQDHVRREMHEALEKRYPFELRYRINKAGGTIAIVREEGHGLYDDEGNLIKVEGYVRDVTVEEQAKEMASINEEMFTNSFFLSPNGMALIRSRDGLVIKCNDTFARIGRLTRETVEGKTTFELGIWDNVEERESFFRELMEKGEMINKELVLHHTDGTQLNLIISARKMLVNGEHCHILSSIDVTEKYMLHSELKLAKEKAEDNDRLKSAFLANMSHEIRTPLNGILGFTELLCEPSATSESIEEYKTIISSCSRQLLNLINDVLDISKIETDNVELEVSEFHLAPLIKEVVAQNKVVAAEHELDIKTELPSRAGSIKLNTDRMRLQQILNNLVGNAMKFTDKGEVSVGFDITPENCRIFVRDTGIGIAEGEKEKVFTRFNQLEPGLKRSRDGAGLGLSIVKGLVELMRGDVGFESKVGEGSTFWISLPYSVDSVDPDRKIIF